MRALLFMFLPVLAFPTGTAAQGRWRAAFFETGLGAGPQGLSKASGIDLELGVHRHVRAVVRWSKRSDASCPSDGECPRDSDVFEMGPGLRISAGSRAVSYANLLLGVHFEEKPLSAERTPYASGSVSIGLDLRVSPPLTVRLALRHQEVPGSEHPRSGTSAARNTGLVVGLGLTTW